MSDNGGQATIDREIQKLRKELRSEIIRRIARVRDIKWFINRLSAAFVIIIAGGSAVAYFNFNSERDRLQKFMDKMEEEIKGQSDDSNLVLLGLNKVSLDNQEIDGIVSRIPNPANPEIIWRYEKIAFIVINKGKSSSDKLWYKIYNNNFDTGQISTDDNNFKYEFVFTPKELTIDTLPGQFSISHNFFFTFKSAAFPKRGKYNAKIKIFYGKGQTAESPIILGVNQDAPAEPPPGPMGILPIPPMPIEVPGADVSADTALFSGVWLGKWEEKFYAAIAVRRIRADDTADISYWEQVEIGGEFKTGPSRWANISGDNLDMGSIHLKIDPNDHSKATGTYDKGEAKPLSGEFKKQ